MRFDGLRTARVIALLFPLALVGGALSSQFIGGLVPCEMCTWQRWAHYAAILFALVAMVAPGRMAAKLVLLILFGALALLLSGVVANAQALAALERISVPVRSPATLWIVGAAALLLVVTLFQRRETRPFSMLLVLLAALGITLSGAIGAFHAGVEYHWWQGITACTTDLKAGDPMDILNEALRKPLVRCDVPQWSLFGISLAGFNTIISLFGALAIFVLAFRKGRR